MEDVKDRPLLLRKRQDGLTYLNSETFPPRHEFSTDWLLENSGNGTASMSGETITLNLANGRAVYVIDRTLMESVREVETPEEAEYYGLEVGDTRVTQLATGYWGILREQEYFSG